MDFPGLGWMLLVSLLAPGCFSTTPLFQLVLGSFALRTAELGTLLERGLKMELVLLFWGLLFGCFFSLGLTKVPFWGCFSRVLKQIHVFWSIFSTFLKGLPRKKNI